MVVEDSNEKEAEALVTREEDNRSTLSIQAIDGISASSILKIREY